METVVARIDENVRAMREEFNTLREDHENRIRWLEKKQWAIIGAGSFIVAAAAIWEALHR